MAKPGGKIEEQTLRSAEAADTETEPALPNGKNGPAEAIYSAKELAAASRKQFGCSYEMVMAAFLYSGKQEATLAEAKQMVSKFRKEV